MDRRGFFQLPENHYSWQMKIRNQKLIAYLLGFLYLAVSFCVLLLDYHIKIVSSVLVFWILFILLFPGMFISFIFGFFGGTKAAIGGAVLTALLFVFLIERYFKRLNHRKTNRPD